MTSLTPGHNRCTRHARHSSVGRRPPPLRPHRRSTEDVASVQRHRSRTLYTDPAFGVS